MNQVSILFQKPTVEEIQQATPMRKRVRAKVLEEVEVSNTLVPYLKTLNAPASFTSTLTQYSSFLDAELAWWNANLELTPTQVTTREIKYDEQIPVLKKAIEQGMVEFLKGRPAPEIQSFIEKYPLRKDKERIRTLLQPLIQSNMTAEQKAQKDLENRGWFDDIADAAVKVISYLSLIVVILLALRWGAFAANEALWQDLPFRALHFTYTTILSIIYFPIALVYQIYKELTTTPYFASVFPITPLPEEAADVGLFGYRVTGAFTKWKAEKTTDFQKKLQESLQKTRLIMEGVKQAKEEAMKSN
jgi:hypothetical protein